MNPDANLPPDLVHALYFVDELSTPEGMDAILAEAERRGLRVECGQDPAPADVIVQIWLLNRDLVERKHAEQYSARLRSYESYQLNVSRQQDSRQPTRFIVQDLETILDNQFEAKKRGRTARILRFDKADGTWFMIRHGDPFRREESVSGKGTSSVAFRPVKYDVVCYLPGKRELRIHARSSWEKELYRAQFGRHMFGNENSFQQAAKYTLEPLREYGEASLNCIDVPGIDWIILREVQLLWGGPHAEIEIRKANDLFAALDLRRQSLPTGPVISRAVFQVKFSDANRPRAVTIQPPRIALYTRDGDSDHVEQWLENRGFIVDYPARQPAAAAEVLAEP